MKKEIQSFEPEEYWSIEGNFKLKDEMFEAKYYGVNGKKQNLANEEDVQAVLKQMKGKSFQVTNVTRRTST